MKNKNGIMSERQAARLIEMYENAMRNGEQWMHDVLLHRGTPKYEDSILTLNEAFSIRLMATVIKPLLSPGKAMRTDSLRRSRTGR